MVVRGTLPPFLFPNLFYHVETLAMLYRQSFGHYYCSFTIHPSQMYTFINLNSGFKRLNLRRLTVESFCKVLCGSPMTDTKQSNVNSNFFTSLMQKSAF